MIILGWRPKLRNVTFASRPEWLDESVYNEALSAKRFYNEQWEFWVWQVAQDYNCSVAEAEDACIRGLKKTLDRIKFIYGDKISKWYIQYLDMGDIFNKVKHPEYINPTLGVETDGRS
jgi:hypothetical protein